MTARDFSFDQTNIVAPAGARVSLTFNNAGPSQHTFTSPTIGADRVLQTGTQAVLSFTMPSTTTVFVCNFHAGRMFGTLSPD